MNINDTINHLRQQYELVGVMDLDTLDTEYEVAWQQLQEFCETIYKEAYSEQERIVFTLTHDYYDTYPIGLRLRTLQRMLNDQDISNYFVMVVSTNPSLSEESMMLQSFSTDPVAVSTQQAQGDYQKLEGKPVAHEIYRYGSSEPVKMSLKDVSKKQKFLLADSKVFCIYPWLHLNANPDSKAYPCCMTSHDQPVGDCKKQNLREIWNGDAMKDIRIKMLNEEPIAGCVRCYEQEEAGFFSGRQSANKHHGHHIARVDETQPDGTLDRFEMVYWDIRFSNLCNLRCRSCGHIYSSQWYKDQAKIAGPDWAKTHKVLNYAGRHETDMWEQLVEHIDHVEQIYFAGGEPLIMDEHYRILEELDRRGRFDVRLIYNTNFTEVRLKDRLVFDYWKKFKSVSVGASLDAMGDRAEYIRKGTTWQEVEENRRKMLEICPGVDFYVSCTLSILNAEHVTEFHRDWVNRGLILPPDFNINILLDPKHYRLDIATLEFKQRIEKLYNEHISWLAPRDSLGRATSGFQSAIKFMWAQDNSHLLDLFWAKTHQLDEIRRENILQVVPELGMLK